MSAFRSVRRQEIRNLIAPCAWMSIPRKTYGGSYSAFLLKCEERDHLGFFRVGDLALESLVGFAKHRILAVRHPKQRVKRCSKNFACIRTQNSLHGIVRNINDPA